MIYYIDIDNTICLTEGMNYKEAKPIKKNISFINALFNAGHKIIYWTSRGVVTCIDYKTLTENQLKDWGCKYHELYLDKPFYDFIIDDKAINVKDIFKTKKGA